jgi:UDP:flavonoid glycosyltransferase YjiC (YdhE family)
VLTALRHGVPVVCVPLGSDHFDIARYVGWAGAGVTVSWDKRSITAAAREVATEPRFRRAARAVADQIATMPAVDDVVREMERRFG